MASTFGGDIGRYGHLSPMGYCLYASRYMGVHAKIFNSMGFYGFTPGGGSVLFGRSLGVLFYL